MTMIKLSRVPNQSFMAVTLVVLLARVRDSGQVVSGEFNVAEGDNHRCKSLRVIEVPSSS